MSFSDSLRHIHSAISSQSAEIAEKIARLKQAQRDIAGEQRDSLNELLKIIKPALGDPWKGSRADTFDESRDDAHTEIVGITRDDYDSYITDWNGKRPFPEGGESYGVIKFNTKEVDSIYVPYGERFGGTNTDGPPCTLNGFTGARNDRDIPEFKFDGRFLPKNGAELYKVENGEEILVEWGYIKILIGIYLRKLTLKKKSPHRLFLYIKD